jgi:hypothetical protein
LEMPETRDRNVPRTLRLESLRYDCSVHWQAD